MQFHLHNFSKIFHFLFWQMSKFSERISQNCEVIKWDYAIVVDIENSVHRAHLLSPENTGVGIFLQYKKETLIIRGIKIGTFSKDLFYLFIQKSDKFVYQLWIRNLNPLNGNLMSLTTKLLTFYLSSPLSRPKKLIQSRSLIDLFSYYLISLLGHSGIQFLLLGLFY